MDSVIFKDSQISVERMPLLRTLDYALRWHHTPSPVVSQALSRSVLTWENPASLLPEYERGAQNPVQRDDLLFLRTHRHWFALPDIPPISVAILGTRTDILTHVCPQIQDSERGAVVWSLLQAAHIARLDAKSWVRAVLTTFPRMVCADMPVERSVVLPWVNQFASEVFVQGGSIGLSCALADCAVYGQFRVASTVDPDGSEFVIPKQVWQLVDERDFEPSGF